MRIDFNMTIEVYDEAEFRAAAQRRALADGLSREEAALYSDPKETDLSNCAVMLFDPGHVVNGGCSIEESTAEEY